MTRHFWGWLHGGEPWPTPRRLGRSNFAVVFWVEVIGGKQNLGELQRSQYNPCEFLPWLHFLTDWNLTESANWIFLLRNEHLLRSQRLKLSTKFGVEKFPTKTWWEKGPSSSKPLKKQLAVSLAPYETDGRQRMPLHRLSRSLTSMEMGGSVKMSWNAWWWCWIHRSILGNWSWSLLELILARCETKGGVLGKLSEKLMKGKGEGDWEEAFCVGPENPHFIQILRWQNIRW